MDSKNVNEIIKKLKALLEDLGSLKETEEVRIAKIRIGAAINYLSRKSLD